MSTNALNNSGCMTVSIIAHVPPMEKPTMPQFFRLVAGTEVRIDEWHNVFGEMIGLVAPWPQRRLTSVFAPNTLWRRCS